MRYDNPYNISDYFVYNVNFLIQAFFIIIHNISHTSLMEIILPNTKKIYDNFKVLNSQYEDMIYKCLLFIVFKMFLKTSLSNI